MRPVAAVITTASCLGLIAACTPTDTPNATISPGLFGPPIYHLVSCSPPGVDKVWFGGRTLTNSGSSPVTIDEVTLDNPTDLTLTDSVLVPDVLVPGGFLIDTNPKKAYPKGQWAWNRRIEAVGARIPPGKTYELVFRTHKDGAVGSFRGVTVTYHDDQHTFRRTDDRWGFMGVRDCSEAEDDVLASLAATATP